MSDEALTAEQIKELQKQAEKAKNLEEELNKMKPEYEKLKTKDFNFRALRNKKFDELPEEDRKKFSEPDQEIIRKTEALEDEIKTMREGTITEAKDRSLAYLAGGDTKLREKIVFHYERLKDEANTPTQIDNKMREAFILATADIPKPNPIMATASMAGSPALPDAKKDFADTQEGQSFLKAFNPNVDWNKK